MLQAVTHRHLLRAPLQGEYTGATETQDDLAIIASMVGYVADDHGNTAATATALTSGEPCAVCCVLCVL